MGMRSVGDCFDVAMAAAAAGSPVELMAPTAKWQCFVTTLAVDVTTAAAVTVLIQSKHLTETPVPVMKWDVTTKRQMPVLYWGEVGFKLPYNHGIEIVVGAASAVYISISGYRLKIGA